MSLTKIQSGMIAGALGSNTALDVASANGTGAMSVPSGNTSQRPNNPVIGYVRFNTDTQLLENYTANGWIKVSVNVPTITSISGTIYSGNTSTLTINGTNFGAGFTGTVIYTAGANTASASATPTSELLITTTVPATVYGWAAGTSVAVSFVNAGGGVSSAYNMTILGLPSGGNTITSVGNTRIHKFNSSSTLTIPTGFSATASYLVVAGGGGGGGYNSGGGGGAGGLVSGTTTLSPNSPITVTVGSGGSGLTMGPSVAPATSGSPSSLGAVSAVGGGYGATNAPSAPGAGGGPGGSGGGGGTDGYSAGTAGSGTPGQGNPGGTSGVSGPSFAGGGGGGAGASGSPAPNTSTAGPGGIGLSSSITGSPVYYAGGGGGSIQSTGTGGTGGNGGGGNGANTSVVMGSNGTINSGGGAGAGGFMPGPSPGNGGSGGSGVVIVSYTLS